MKGEIKWGHLCEGVLKWSQEGIEEVSLMHILARRNHELLNGGPNPKYPEDSAQTATAGYERLCLVTVLGTNYIQPRSVFYHQLPSKFFHDHI